MMVAEIVRVDNQLDGRIEFAFQIVLSHDSHGV